MTTEATKKTVAKPVQKAPTTVSLKASPKVPMVKKPVQKTPKNSINDPPISTTYVEDEAKLARIAARAKPVRKTHMERTALMKQYKAGKKPVGGSKSNGRIQKPIIDSTEMKKCTRCAEVKPVEDFNTIKRTGRLRPECRECSLFMSRRYKAQNSDKIGIYNKEYKAEHKEETSVYNSVYNVENRAAIQKRQTAQHRERKKVDPNYKISGELRAALRNYVGSEGKNSKKLMERLLGCTWEQFKPWFEYQFDDTMTFFNHGKIGWEIDHVVPCCAFDLTDENQQLICFNWANSRPMDSTANKSKNGKICQDTINEHATVVKEFMKTLSATEKKKYSIVDWSNTDNLNTKQ